MNSFVDTEGYAEVLKFLKNAQFVATQTHLRGQTFPAVWWLSQQINISYSLLAFVMSLIAVLLLKLCMPRDGQLARWISTITCLLILSSHATFDFLTTYLTESLTFTFIALWLAASVAFFRHVHQSILVVIRDVIVYAILLVAMHSLKPWLLILPLVFLVTHIILHGVIALVKAQKTRYILIVKSLLALFIGLGASRFIYSPAPEQSPVTNNLRSFLRIYKADVFINNRLENGWLSDNRRNELEQAYSDAKRCAFDSHSACAHISGGVIKEVFFKAYLSDFAGPVELSRIGMQRWWNNVRHGDSSSTAYGTLKDAGHTIFSRNGKIMVLFIPIHLFVFLGSIALYLQSAWLRFQNLSETASIRLIRCLSLSAASTALILFLGVGSGGLEPGRVEQPGYLIFLLSLPILLLDGLAYLRFTRSVPE